MKLKLKDNSELQLMIDFITHNNHNNKDNYLSLINKSILKSLLVKLLKKQLNNPIRVSINLEFHEGLALYQMWTETSRINTFDYSTVKIMQKMNLLHKDITAQKSRI